MLENEGEPGPDTCPSVQSFNQLINQSINQSVSQSVNQSISQSIKQQSVRQSISLSINQSIYSRSRGNGCPVSLARSSFKKRSTIKLSALHYLFIHSLSHYPTSSRVFGPSFPRSFFMASKTTCFLFLRK